MQKQYGDERIKTEVIDKKYTPARESYFSQVQDTSPTSKPELNRQEAQRRTPRSQNDINHKVSPSTQIKHNNIPQQRDRFKEVNTYLANPDYKIVKEQIRGIWHQVTQIKKHTMEINQIKTMLGVVSQKLDTVYKAQQQKKQQSIQSNKAFNRFTAQIQYIFNQMQKHKLSYLQHNNKVSPASSHLITTPETNKNYQVQEIKKIDRKSDNFEYSLDQYKMSVQKVKHKVPEPTAMQLQSIRPFLISSILSTYQHSQLFLKENINNFTGKTIKDSALIYQLDKFNKNIGNYIQQGPFPYLLLIQSTHNTVFGVFGEGIEVRSTQHIITQSKPQKFKAFMFNLDKKQLFQNQRKSTSITSAVYSDGSLRFGNNQMVIRNNYLSSIKVFAGSILGESYYNVRYRNSLTGIEGEEVQVKALQLHMIDFQGSKA